MSGGSHDYAYMKLKDIADDFVPDSPPPHAKERQKVADILNHMATICHDIEWIDSADYCEEDWKKVEEMLNRIKLE